MSIKLEDCYYMLHKTKTIFVFVKRITDYIVKSDLDIGNILKDFTGDFCRLSLVM